MATSSDFKDFVFEQLKSIDGLSCKKMMGEYLLYVKGTLVGGIYDDRLLLKPTESNGDYGMQEELPYAGAKTFMLAASVDDAELLAEITLKTFYDLNKSL